MALFDAYKKNSTLKAAIKQTTKARKQEGAKADQLYLSAYEGFAEVVQGDLLRGEALYNWGFALLHHAKNQANEDGVKLYLDAISKFTFCLLVQPNHLGAAIDGGVAYMDLARIMHADASDELYDLADEFFRNAERIQRGSAAYNLACIFGLKGEKDACLDALALAKECGSLPNVDDIENDVDMDRVKNETWFVEFIEQAKAQPKPEADDENVVKYDVEGNVIQTKKKRVFENIVDGVAYDAEGNVIREVSAEEEAAQEKENSEKIKETTEVSTEETTEATTEKPAATSEQKDVVEEKIN